MKDRDSVTCLVLFVSFLSFARLGDDESFFDVDNATAIDQGRRYHGHAPNYYHRQNRPPKSQENYSGFVNNKYYNTAGWEFVTAAAKYKDQPWHNEAKKNQEAHANRRPKDNDDESIDRKGGTDYKDFSEFEADRKRRGGKQQYKDYAERVPLDESYGDPYTDSTTYNDAPTHPTSADNNYDEADLPLDEDYQGGASEYYGSYKGKKSPYDTLKKTHFRKTDDIPIYDDYGLGGYGGGYENDHKGYGDHKGGGYDDYKGHGHDGYDDHKGYGHKGGYDDHKGYGHKGGYDDDKGYGHKGGYDDHKGYGHKGGYDDDKGYGHKGGYDDHKGYGHKGGYDDKGKGGYDDKGYGHKGGYNDNKGHGGGYGKGHGGGYGKGHGGGYGKGHGGGYGKGHDGGYGKGYGKGHGGGYGKGQGGGYGKGHGGGYHRIYYEKGGRDNSELGAILGGVLAPIALLFLQQQLAAGRRKKRSVEETEPKKDDINEHAVVLDILHGGISGLINSIGGGNTILAKLLGGMNSPFVSLIGGPNSPLVKFIWSRVSSRFQRGFNTVERYVDMASRIIAKSVECTGFLGGNNQCVEQYMCKRQGKVSRAVGFSDMLSDGIMWFMENNRHLSAKMKHKMQVATKFGLKRRNGASCEQVYRCDPNILY